jgi:hypothetical protein
MHLRDCVCGYSWEEMTEEETVHATTLGFTGPIWDGEHEQKLEQTLELATACGGCDTVCMLSNIMYGRSRAHSHHPLHLIDPAGRSDHGCCVRCYCTDDQTADFFTALLSPGGGAFV